jgi:hypothetical protein
VQPISLVKTSLGLREEMQTEALLHMTKWLVDGGQFMTGITENQ